jgi:hypothetical protein
VKGSCLKIFARRITSSVSAIAFGNSNQLLTAMRSQLPLVHGSGGDAWRTCRPCFQIMANSAATHDAAAFMTSLHESDDIVQTIRFHHLPQLHLFITFPNVLRGRKVLLKSPLLY